VTRGGLHRLADGRLSIIARRARGSRSAASRRLASANAGAFTCHRNTHRWAIRAYWLVERCMSGRLRLGKRKLALLAWRGRIEVCRRDASPTDYHPSVLVFRRREQDQLDTIRAIDIGIMAGRNLEEVAGGDARLNACLDHANYELAGNAVARVAHRA
jgi:hypothetical protein